MFAERLAEFSRDRLGGLDVPDDLRTMLVAQWEGRTEIGDLLDIRFVEPGEDGPLYAPPPRRPESESAIVNAGAAAMSAYAKLIAEDGNGNWIGYWVHPDEPSDRPPLIVGRDTEATWFGLPGSTLAQACAAQEAEYQDETDVSRAFADVADRLAALGLEIGTRDHDSLDSTPTVVDPEKLNLELEDAERARRRGSA